ncbi:MAG TPA: spermidine/putrescine ABC transporter substrate-binding protein [bacterium]|nr:spermidine/putrescine ABC transporter substrate-binding protein [bacterium]
MGKLPKISCFLLFTTLVILAVGGCQSNVSCRQSDSASPEAVTIRVFNWEAYLAPETLGDFTTKTGIRVELETFPDQEYMLAHLQSEPAKYDVVFPSRDMLCRLIELKLLAELDSNKLPTYKKTAFDHSQIDCDPEHKYYVPYLTGTTGLAYNKKYIKKTVTGWRDLLDPQYAQKAALLNNIDEVLAIALKMHGRSINANDPETIRAAGKTIAQALPHMRGFLDPIRIRDMLIAEELIIAHVYSGEGHIAEHENPNVVYIIPREGCVQWMDLLAIPAASTHREAALRFIDYMTEPAVNAACARFLRYDTPNLKARAILWPEGRSERSEPTTVDETASCEYFNGLEKSRNERNRVWATLNKRR